MSKHLYIFSGLGADERVFQLLDLSGFSVTFIRWIVPDTDEAMEQYAIRLLDQIKTLKPILIGLSFGGMMAVEVAKLIDTEKVILIASAKTKYEIPFYYRVAGWLRLHRLLPTSLLKYANFVTNWLFGATTASEKQVLKQILIDTDPIFLRWAIDKVAQWKNCEIPASVIQIHGTCDKILPIYFVKWDIKIQGGGHLMTLDKADEISRYLRQSILVNTTLSC